MLCKTDQDLSVAKIWKLISLVANSILTPKIQHVGSLYEYELMRKLVTSSTDYIAAIANYAKDPSIVSHMLVG